MQPEGKVALITGGGTGIGKEIGLLLAGQGMHIVVNYSRSAKEAEETAQAIQQLGVSSLTVQADVSQDDQVRAMLKKVETECGRLDVLVNNAGHTTFVQPEDLEGLTEDIWDRILAVNVKGTFFCCRAAAPALKQHGNGCVINTSSIAGTTGVGSNMAYSASKAAVICLTKSLARTLAPEVRVNTIAPGFVDTRWTADWPEYKQMHEESTPLQRVAQPTDVAEAALFLVRSDFVTGQVLIVDGGKSM